MEYDRITKYALYEAYGVKEYWLVDAAARSVEVFVLRGGRYELLGIFGRGADARSEVLAGFTAEVDEISA